MMLYIGKKRLKVQPIDQTILPRTYSSSHSLHAEICISEPTAARVNISDSTIILSTISGGVLSNVIK